MIIRTYVPPKKVENEKKKPVVVEEVKQEDFIPKKKNKKAIPAHTVEETAVEVFEDDKIDLNDWLKEESIED